MKVNNIIYFTGFMLFTLYVATFSLFPLSGEDFALTKQFHNDGIISRITFSISRSAHQIDSWNARLGEQLAIFSLSMPSIYFIAVSFVFFALFCYLVCTLCAVEKTPVIKSTLIGSIVIAAFWPGMEVFFWKTANAGYLQPMVITIGSIALFFNDKTFESKQKYVSLIVLCFLSGISFENVPIAVIFILSIYVLLYKKCSTKILMPIVSMLVGWCLLIFSPSTIKRSEFYKKALNIPDLSFSYVLERANDVVSLFIKTSLPLLVVSICALIFLYSAKKMNVKVTLLIIASILVDGSMIMSPYTEARAFMFSWCAMASVVSYSIIIIIRSHYKPGVILVSLFSIFAISSFANAFKASVDFSVQNSIRESKINDSILNGNCNNGIKVSRIKSDLPYRYLNNRENWFFGNLDQISKYYECRIIK